MVVVDDQQLVRTGFSALLALEEDIEVVGEAANGEEAVRLCASLRPDVILMDIRMPVLDGVEATQRIVDASGSDGLPRVVILTTFDLDELVHAALRAGASGFLLKDSPPEELLRAVRVVAAGDALLAPSITRRLLTQFGSAAQQGAKNARLMKAIEQLTEREREVLGLMARGLTNNEIAEATFVAETTVKTHVSHIFTKLGARDRVQAVVLAYDAGLVQPGHH